MLLEKTDELILDLDTYEKTKEMSSKTRDLTNRLSKAKDIHNMLIRIDMQKTFFTQNSMLVDLKDVFSGLASSLDDLNNTIKEDSANILEPNVFWRTDHIKLENKAKEVFIFNWKEYISEHLMIKDAKELKIWAQIPELSGEARKLRGFVSEVEELKEHLPSIKEIQLIETIASTMKSFMSNLDKVGIPDNVSEFLSKASTLGVSLSDVNAEVLDWLDKHNMKQYCQVKLTYDG